MLTGNETVDALLDATKLLGDSSLDIENISLLEVKGLVVIAEVVTGRD